MDRTRRETDQVIDSSRPHRRAVLQGGAAALATFAGATALAAARQATPDPDATPDGQERYVAIRTWRFAAGKTYADLTDPIESGYFPILQAAPGFVAHYILDVGDGMVMAVSVWESKDAADESTRLATDFVAATLADFFEAAPEIVEGPAPLYREGSA
jgi:hypothetical protein